jgi:DUF2075 family protein
MIVYNESVNTFIQECFPVLPNSPTIGDIISQKMHEKGISFDDSRQQAGIVGSWNASLPRVAQALIDGGFDPNLMVGVEYKINQHRNRIDFLIYGLDEKGNRNVVILELKQWSDAEKSNLRNFVYTNGGNGLDDYQHPSCQAHGYAEVILNTYAYAQDNKLNFEACSYLHNMPESRSTLLDDDTIFPVVDSTPVFLQDDAKKLIDFIHRYVKAPCREDILYYLDESAIRPSPMLAKMLTDALHGNANFFTDEYQARAEATIVAAVKDAIRYGTKETIIIRGGPGTGKSVVALQALGELIQARDSHDKNHNVAYFTENAAPRNMYLQRLVGSESASTSDLSVFFKNPTIMQDAKWNEYEAVLIDEAHRVTKKNRFRQHGDYDLVDKIIYGSQVSVFFIDEDQAVTTMDYATIDRIKHAAEKNNSKLIDEPGKLTLQSQFRVLGGDEYIDFIKGFLGYIPSTKYLLTKNYDFRVFDNASDMRDLIRTHNRQEGLSRMVAGYDFEWVSKKDYDGSPCDIVLDGGQFQAKWNRNSSVPGYSWLNDPDSVEDVGCIHTAQGLDMNYCGVIIGDDLRYENGKLVFDQTMIAKSDTSSHIRHCPDPILAMKLIRNTYNVLLTRGMKGTYVYCVDKGLRDYLRSLIITLKED